MAGNRKLGYLRGNASGRNGSNTPPKWFCAGCIKNHGGRVFKTGYKGNLYCDRSYLKLKSQEWEISYNA